MSNERAYNFSAGPSMLPLSVIEDAAANPVSYTHLAVYKRQLPLNEGIQIQLECVDLYQDGIAAVLIEDRCPFSLRGRCRHFSPFEYVGR